jgi:hypothetical protein
MQCPTAQETDSIQSMTPLSNTDMIVASALLKDTAIKGSSQKASIQHSGKLLVTGQWFSILHRYEILGWGFWACNGYLTGITILCRVLLNM